MHITKLIPFLLAVSTTCITNAFTSSFYSIGVRKSKESSLAFCIIKEPVQKKTTSIRIQNSSFYGSQDDNIDELITIYTQDEIQNMRELIQNLSFLTDDTARRDQVKQTIALNISDNDDTLEAAKFANLFDKLLILIGGEVQDAARRRAMAEEVIEKEDKALKVEGDNGDEDIAAPPREKSKDELQLWALVDMMVQSKSLIKQALG